MTTWDSYGVVADGDQLNDGYFNAVGSVPVGAVIAWLKSYTNTPALPSQYVECNGQVLSDAASVYNGQTIPNLNASGGGSQRFLRGSTTSGSVGGADATGLLSHNGDGIGNIDNNASGNHIPATSILPSYYEVVWVMRIK